MSRTGAAAGSCCACRALRLYVPAGRRSDAHAGENGPAHVVARAGRPQKTPFRIRRTTGNSAVAHHSTSTSSDNLNRYQSVSRKPAPASLGNVNAVPQSVRSGKISVNCSGSPTVGSPRVDETDGSNGEWSVLSDLLDHGVCSAPALAETRRNFYQVFLRPRVRVRRLAAPRTRRTRLVGSGTEAASTNICRNAL